jgi:hypothetical protein
MRITRLIELTLFHHVKSIFARTRKEKPKSADFRTYSLKYTNILPEEVKVYKNGFLVGNTEYFADYINSIIVFNLQQSSSDVIEVEYRYCPINIYDEGSNPSDDNFKYPAIAIFEIDSDHIGKELGSNKKEKHPTWGMEVWTERGGERHDITDTIVESLEEGTLPILNYNDGFPVESDGSINDSFDYGNIVGYMSFDSINYRKGGSLDIGDKKKYIAEILIELTIND